MKQLPLFEIDTSAKVIKNPIHVWLQKNYWGLFEALPLVRLYHSPTPQD
jgi:hypothetical protein